MKREILTLLQLVTINEMMPYFSWLYPTPKTEIIGPHIPKKGTRQLHKGIHKFLLEKLRAGRWCSYTRIPFLDRHKPASKVQELYRWIKGKIKMQSIRERQFTTIFHFSYGKEMCRQLPPVKPYQPVVAFQ